MGEFIGSIKLSGLLVCLVLMAGSLLLESDPTFRWTWCWLGSCLLLLASMRGLVFSIPTDLHWTRQTLRPWLLINIIYCGYNFLTSVFYWMDINGYYFLTLRPDFEIDLRQIELASLAQQYYLVGHIALVMGMGCVMQPAKQTIWRLQENAKVAQSLLVLAVVSFTSMNLFSLLPGLGQLAVRAKGMTTIACATALGISFQTKSRWMPLALAVNAVLGIVALSSGWKEEVLVLVILNAITFFPSYPKLTSTVTACIIVLGFVVLPPLANEIRANSWRGGADRFEALAGGIETIQGKSIEELQESSWSFLTGRLSEIGLFSRYLDSVPEYRPFYGTKIVEQALLTPVPRVFWPGKQVTEKVVHQRVVENGVVSEYSVVSAKPQFVVDGFLSQGAVGVFLCMLFFGVAVQTSFQWCESNLGGPLLGGVMFNGLFSFCWRGSCFEFFSNSFVWSVILAIVLHQLLKTAGVIEYRAKN